MSLAPRAARCARALTRAVGPLLRTLLLLLLLAASMVLPAPILGRVRLERPERRDRVSETRRRR